MSDLDQFRQIYFQECEELLGDMESHLMAIDAGEADADTLNAVFRAVHSVKGGAGAFGFERLVKFAHTFETVLDWLRDGRLEASREVVAVLLRAGDVLVDLVRAARAGEELAPGQESEVHGELAALAGESPSAASGDEAVAEDPDLGFAFVPVSAEAMEDEAPVEEPDIGFDFQPVAAEDADVPAAADEAPPGAFVTWRITFKPKPEMLRDGTDPLPLVRELKGLGAVNATVDASRLPGLDDIDPEAAYLSWTFEVETAAGRAAVEDVFGFVGDDCEIAIAEVSRAAPPPPPAPEPVSVPAPKPAPAAKPAEPAKAEGKAPAAAAGAAAPTIRVDLDKVDRLVNMVGELVITQAMLFQQATDIPTGQFPAIFEGLDELSHHTRELQDNVMAIRAQPIKSVFQRIPRLVRELAAQTGKEVQLVTRGENTEVDKTVVERLGDPLTHMIRNAVDHGIETPDEREAHGKPRQGTITLSAEHRGGRIVIEITDDGRGINRERVLAKALEKKLVPAGAALSDEEIDNLIFAPGFSTAEKVSDISGRGVGMDVVKRNIQDLGGRVSISSVPGRGSRFLLTLPLTLAVLDGMILAAGRETYILPVASVIESLRPTPRDLHNLVGRGEVLSIRGEYIELVHLHRVFGIDGAITDPSKAIVVLVESGEENSKVALVVDELVGMQQVVIKSLEENYQRVEGVAGATILGDGKVALILDVPGLRALSRRHTHNLHRLHNRPPAAITSEGMLEP